MAITGTGTTDNNRFKVTKPGTAGSDTIDGKAGLDAVSFYGKFTDFTINVDNDILSVSHKTTGDEYQLTAIEKIIFSDNKQVSVSPEAIVNVDTKGAQTDVTVLTLPALPAFAKVDATPTTPEIPAVPAFDGGFINFWQGVDGYYFRKFDANGVALTLDQKILDGITGGVKPALQYQAEVPGVSAATTNIILAWSAPDGDQNGISVQLFNAEGTSSSPIFHANDTITDEQSQPSIAVLTDGSFVVAWTSANQGDALQNEGIQMGETPNQAGVFAQHFDSLGNPLGWETKVSDSGASDAFVTALQDGGYVINYEGIAQVTKQMIISAKFFDNDDQIQHVIDPVNTTFESVEADSKTLAYNEFASKEKLPVAAQLASGNVVMVWQAPGDAYLTAGGSFVHDGRIAARVFTASGVEITAEDVVVNTFTTYEQSNPAVAALTGGGFVVVWQSMQQDGSYWGVYGQRFDSTGGKVGGEFQVNTKTQDSQKNPSVTALADGGFVVSWEAQYQDGNQQGIFQTGDAATEIVQQRYDASGVAIGNTFAGGNGDDAIAIGGSGNVEIDGGAGKDTLISGTGDDVLRGGFGNDILNAGTGTNTIIGGEGVDILKLAGVKADYDILATNGTYKVVKPKTQTYAGLTDYLQGVEKIQFDNNTADVKDDIFLNLIGYTGGIKGYTKSSLTSKVETLEGGNDNDDLTGGNLSGASDTLDGGDGDDRYTAIGTKLIIHDTDGIDTLVIKNIGSNGKAIFTAPNIDLSSPLTNTISGLDAIENVDLSSTGSAALKLTGNDENNILTGNAGGNVISGGLGDDSIYGLAGGDNLSGGAGDDIIYGGNGNDKLSGGDGTDIFVFDFAPNAKTNADSISDFSGDKIQLDSTVFQNLDLNSPLDAHGNPVVNFIQGAGLKGASGSSKAFMVYDSKAGNIYYDAAGSTGPVLITKVGTYEPHQSTSTDPATGQTTTTTTIIFHPAILSAADFILM